MVSSFKSESFVALRLCTMIILFAGFASCLGLDKCFAGDVPPSNAEPIEKKIMSAEFDHLEFNDEPLSSVVKQISDRSSINIRLLFKPEKDDSPFDPTVKYSEKHVSFMDCIKEICVMLSLEYLIDKDAVVITSYDIAQRAVIIKEYAMQFEHWDCDRGSKESKTAEIKKAFSRNGCVFSSNCIFQPEPSISRLYLTDTPYNHMRMQEIVRSYTLTDPQVYIEAIFIKVPESDLANVATKLNISSYPSIIDTTFVPYILESRNLEVIADGAVVTQNGEEAVIRLITEKYFPEEYEPDCISMPEKSEDGDINADSGKGAAILEKTGKSIEGKSCISIMPELSSPDELGLWLTVTPCVDANRKSISLDMHPFLSSCSGFSEYNIGGRAYKMPVIDAWSDIAELGLPSNNSTYDGGFIVHSCGMNNIMNSSEGPQSRAILLVTAKLVEPDGSLFRGEQEDLGKSQFLDLKQIISDTDLISAPEQSLPTETVKINVQRNTLFFMLYPGYNQECVPPQVTSEGIRKYLKDIGIDFPEGSALVYESKESSLTVTNIRNNINLIQHIIRLFEFSHQVQIQSTFVEISWDDYEKLVGKAGLFDFPGKDLFPKVMKSGNGKIICSNQTIVTSGQKSISTQLKTLNIPNTWSKPCLVNINGKEIVEPPVPQFDHSTEFGNILDVTATLDPSRKLITLQLEPKFVNLAGWSEEFKCEIFDSTLASNKLLFEYPLKMPIIDKIDLKSTVKIYDGETIIAGKIHCGFQRLNGSIWDKDKDEDKIVLIFVTARLVNPDGKPTINTNPN